MVADLANIESEWTLGTCLCFCKFSGTELIVSYSDVGRCQPNKKCQDNGGLHQKKNWL